MWWDKLINSLLVAIIIVLLLAIGIGLYSSGVKKNNISAANSVVTACKNKPTRITITINPLWQTVQFSCLHNIIEKTPKKDEDINI